MSEIPCIRSLPPGTHVDHVEIDRAEAVERRVAVEHDGIIEAATPGVLTKLHQYAETEQHTDAECLFRDGPILSMRAMP